MFNDYVIRNRKTLKTPSSMTLEQGRIFTGYLEGTGCHLYQSSYIRGYQTRNECTAYKYIGRYGIGFAIVWPNKKSTNYSIIEYYTFKD